MSSGGGLVLPPGMPPLASIAGPLMLGFLFNVGLFGVLSVQLYIYYLAFPNDRLPIKCLVYGTFLIELAQAILVFHDAFKIFGSGFGNLMILSQVNLLWVTAPLMSGLVSCTVQIFYAYRIFVLSTSKLLALVISLIAFMQCVGGITAGAQAAGGIIDQLVHKTYAASTIWLSGSAACDILIAASMTVVLLRRKDTMMPSTHAIVTRIVRLVVETGSLTAAAAIVDLVLFLRFPHLPYHVCSAVTLAKLYSNSLLVILNSRAHITNGRNPMSSGTAVEQTGMVFKSVKTVQSKSAGNTSGTQTVDAFTGSGNPYKWEENSDVALEQKMNTEIV